MRYKILILLLWLGVAVSAQLKVSILGDSYSTFKEWIPEGNLTWYGVEQDNDVKKVEQTWWHQLIANNGLQLEVNNSYSGATICNTGYDGKDYSDRSFLTRAADLGDAPDIIYVFGGTNDDWARSPIGKGSGSDMYTVRPAAKAMLKKIKKAYPEAVCLVIINSELKAKTVDAIKEACENQGVPYVQLRDIDKQSGHPSVKGMQAIASQVWAATQPLIKKKLNRRKAVMQPAA